MSINYKPISLLDFRKAHDIPQYEMSDAVAMQIQLPFSNMEGGLHIIVVRGVSFIGIDMDEQSIPFLMAAQLVFMYSPDQIDKFDLLIRDTSDV